MQSQINKISLKDFPELFLEEYSWVKNITEISLLDLDMPILFFSDISVQMYQIIKTKGFECLEWKEYINFINLVAQSNNIEIQEILTICIFEHIAIDLDTIKYLKTVLNKNAIKHMERTVEFWIDVENSNK